MKLLTLNAHSHVEEAYPDKLRHLIEAVEVFFPDVIALQESSQTLTGHPVPPPPNFLLPENVEVSLTADNHALLLAEGLGELGLPYYWCWLPVKIGYGRLREGLAILSRRPIRTARAILLSRRNNPADWRTRKALAITTEESDTVFCSVHLGRWDDPVEPFADQWKRLHHALSPFPGQVFLMGDFNAPAHASDEGYTRVLADGWHDTYAIARKKNDGSTVRHSIDGWRDGGVSEEMRIDYIFSRLKPSVVSSYTVFDGQSSPAVSDHCGILTEIQSEV